MKLMGGGLRSTDWSERGLRTSDLVKDQEMQSVSHDITNLVLEVSESMMASACRGQRGCGREYDVGDGQRVGSGVV
jgi:hypothetical protein